MSDAIETPRVVVLLDESGSMGALRGTVIQSTNKYLKDIKGKGLITVATFDKLGEEPILRVIMEDVPVKKAGGDLITEDNYFPRGWTPLYDAMRDLAKRVDKNGNKPAKVLFVINTDGLENASLTTADEMKKMVAKYEKRGWSFIYLGAHADSWAESAKIGLARAGHSIQTVNTAVGTQTRDTVVAAMTTDYLSKGGEYDADEWAKKVGKKIEEDAKL